MDANSNEVTALCEALERAMRSFGHVSTAHYERPCREAMAAALNAAMKANARASESVPSVEQPPARGASTS